MAARWLLDRLGPVVLRGPVQVPAERSEHEDALVVVARHDGYRSRFGVFHERRLRLPRTGEALEGEDAFPGDRDPASPETATLRFHLAPGVRANRAKGGRVIMLMLPNGEAWQFEASTNDARVEESVFYAATDGARRTDQIVVPVSLRDQASVRWRFERLTRGEGQR